MKPPQSAGAKVRHALSAGRRVVGERVVLFFSPGPGSFATVAGKRVGGAVERNRARRILRAAWSEVSARRAEEGIDVVLVARPAIRGAKTHELIAEMTELARRAEVIRP